MKTINYPKRIIYSNVKEFGISQAPPPSGYADFRKELEARLYGIPMPKEDEPPK